MVLVSGIVLAQYALSDRMAEAYARVHLVEQGWASQRRWLGRSLVRHERCGGSSGDSRRAGWPPWATWRLSQGRPRLTGGGAPGLMQQLKGQGGISTRDRPAAGRRRECHPQGAAAFGMERPSHRFRTECLFGRDRLRTQTCPVLPALPLRHRCHLHQGRTQTCPLLLRSREDLRRPARTPIRGIGAADRLLARLGLLEDAPPLFGSATAVPRAGVLLALPVLVASGVFECAQKIYGSLGPGLLWIAHQSCSRCCSWRCGASNARRVSRNIRRRTWGECWGWTGRRKSKRCGANWRAWPPPDAPPSSARLWPSNGWHCAEHGPGLSLPRRPRAGLPRPARIAQSPRGPHAHLDAGHLGLLGQR